MPTVTLRVEHSDGSTDTVTGIEAAKKRFLDEQDRGWVTVYRDSWKSFKPNLQERTDKLYIDHDGTEKFGGRFDDSESSKGTVKVKINSPEIDAADAEPTGNNYLKENAADDVIATEQINAVNTLSAGTVTQQAASISYSASHASRSKILYDLREITGSEFRYNNDWTVDYVDRIGTDKSGSITLGPANSNIGDDFEKNLDEREQVTHVRVLGGQEGPKQVTAEAVASGYTAGERQKWRRYENKEILRASRAQSIADSLVSEYDGEPRSLEVTCSVYGETVNLGDTVTVDYPEEDISRTLRIVELETLYTASEGAILSVKLANRNLSKDRREAKRNDDLQRFNRGYQGFVDRDQTTAGWNPAGDGVPQTLEIPNWPDDIVTEDTVELTVQGRAWRSPVDTGGHTHNVSVTHPSHTHDVTHPSHSHSVSVTHPSHTHDVTHPSHSHSVSVTHPSHSHNVTHPTHDHSFSVTHPTHDHAFSVTHPSHSHDVNHPSHNHGISTTSTNNTASSYQTDNFTGFGIPYDSSWSNAYSISPSNPTSLIFVHASVFNADTDCAVELRLYNTTTNTELSRSGIVSICSGTSEKVTVALLGSDDANGESVALQIRHEKGDVGGDSADIDADWTIIQKHKHDISTTSNSSLGTTETSTTALGTTESTTSDTALGTTTSTTSDTALGTTETSTTSLGTTESATSDTKLGTTETSTTALGTTETSTSDTKLGTTETSSSALGTTETATSDSSSDLIPQVIDTFNTNQYYPTDVEIRVNGTLVTTISGNNSAKWTSTVDLSGQLNAGSNTITATPTTTRGSVNLILYSELFRSGPKSN